MFFYVFKQGFYGKFLDKVAAASDLHAQSLSVI